MTACETCWTEASRKALMLGGFTADRYRDELADHPEHGSYKASPDYLGDMEELAEMHEVTC
jgi:hypothetical protein